jgi:hypothetical protein
MDEVGAGGQRVVVETNVACAFPDLEVADLSAIEVRTAIDALVR